MDDDAYDVRAVERRLAHMEAVRRARVAGAAASSTVPSSTPRVLDRTRVVGDFELSGIDDSSASEDELDSDASASTSSASEHDDEVRVTGGRIGMLDKKKTKLRDSLDLSMSVSIALPAEKDKREVKTQPKASNVLAKVARDSRNRIVEQEGMRGNVMVSRVEPQAVVPMSSVSTANPVHDDDIFAGKLVQRRRELERMAVQHAQHHQLPRRRELPHCSAANDIDCLEPAFPVVAPPLLAKGELKHPVVMVSRPHVRKDGSITTTSEHERSCGVSNGIPEKQSAKEQGESIPDISKESSKGTGRERSSAVHGKRQEPTSHGAIAPLESTPDVSKKPTDMDRTSKRGSAQPCSVAVAPPAPMKQNFNQSPNHEENTSSPHLAVALKSKKSAAPTSIPPSLPGSSSTGGSALNSKPLGYARANVASNQSQTSSAPTTKKIASPTKREPEDHPIDDVIDDLLTAEELRLRESLDKLTNRLSSLASARLPPATQPAKTSNQPASNPPELHDDMTVRSAAYGGGTHSRLHQPMSPTSRASHAKRAELSGGVHKARVRVGGVTAQEAAASRTEMTADGKHKIVIKKDLAHLLF